jgi:hypothetical protein
MSEKICILFSGIENLNGVDAVALIKRFNLKEYGGVKIGQMGKFWYGDFDPVILRKQKSAAMRDLLNLFIWFGLKKCVFRFDSACLADTAVHHRIHIEEQSDKYISIPKVSYS